MNEVCREETESTSAPESDNARNKFPQRLLKI
jgi:hypothetical protein